MKEPLLISSCFLGNNTKYNGGNNLIEELDILKGKYELVIVCPEVSGGLTTPREPSEIKGDKVYSFSGKDVTKEFYHGATVACELVKKFNIKKALLKEGSPSCGSSKIYDGNFSGTKICGQGITAKQLIGLGVTIYTEDNWQDLI